MVEQRNRAQYAREVMQQAQEQYSPFNLNPAFAQPSGAGESLMTRAAQEAGLTGLAKMAQTAGGAPTGEDGPLGLPITPGGKNKKKKRKK